MFSPPSEVQVSRGQARVLSRQWGRCVSDKLFSALFSSLSSHSFGLLPEILDSRSVLSDLVAISHIRLYKFKLKLIIVK